MPQGLSIGAARWLRVGWRGRTSSLFVKVQRCARNATKTLYHFFRFLSTKKIGILFSYFLNKNS